MKYTLKKIIMILVVILIAAVCFGGEADAIVPEYVAEMNGKQYESLADAVANVPADNTPHTITLLNHATGDGIDAREGQNIIFDFNGYTYTVGPDESALVGPNGNVSQAMRLMQDSKVVLKNGTLTSTNARMLVNNYGDIVLEDFILDANGSKAQYTLSNNCGSVVVKGDSEILAKEGGYAFDLWYGMFPMYYEGITVRFDKTFTGTVDGDIEYGAKTSTENWIDRTALIIDGNGTFNTEFKVSSNLDHIENANITILGGTFTSDVSSFIKNTENLVKTADGYKVCYHNNVTNTVEYSEGKAVSTVVCSNCNKTWKTETTHTHTFIETETEVAPTYESLGYKTYVCQCGAGKTEILPATGHKFTNYKPNGDATCQKNETETAECEFGCGETDTREIADSTVGHKFTVYTSDNNAECEKDGTKTAVCDYGCGNKKTVTDTGSALNHSWNTATYTFAADGSVCTSTRTCKRNANHKETAIATITSKVTTAATCETKGKTTYTATFTEDWATTQTKVVTDVKALGHDYESAVTKKATCIAKGVKTYTCKNDKTHTYTEEIAINSKNHVNTTEKAEQKATCTAKGYTAGTYCNDCKKWISGHSEIAALGHDYEGVVTKKATCIAKGVKTYTCRNDKSHTYTQEIAIDKNAHSWSATGPECTLCKLEDEIVRVTKAYYNITSYNAGDKWSTDATVTFEATFKNHSAKVKFSAPTPSGLDMNKAGTYVVNCTYKGIAPEVKPSCTIYPANTTSFTASAQTTTTVTLKWAAAKGANGYRIFYKAPGDTKWRTINDTTALSYKVKGLKAGTKYTFAVRPFYDTGSEKLFSKKYPTIATATCTATPELTSVRDSSTKGKVYVYHTDVTGETGYTVYYSTSKTSGFKKYDNFAADTTRCDITGLTSGKTYYFKVRTYIKTDSGYVYSPWSAVKGVKIK